MKHSIAHSVKPDSDQALEEVLVKALDGLDGEKPTLGLLFLTQHHQEAAERLAGVVHEKIAPAALLGCTAESMIVNEREIERRPVVSLWLASWPGAVVRPFHLDFEGEDENGTFVGWPTPMPDPAEKPAFLLLPDPFTTPADFLLDRLNRNFPGSPAFGGVASGGSSPGQNRLIVGEEVHDRGVAGAIITGAVKVETVVSQGCKPVGRPFIITKAERNAILALGGKPAYAQLQEVYQALSAPEQEIARRSLHVGQVIDEMKDTFARGDFLIRNVMGVDPKSGAVIVGDVIRPGRTIQFQLRDAGSAKEDLRLMLRARRERGILPPGSGALLVSCNGRGSRLFGEPDQDSSAVAEAFGGIPVGGFFAAGEVGPVGGRNFLHGFTASIALFSPKEPTGDK